MTLKSQHLEFNVYNTGTINIALALVDGSQNILELLNPVLSMVIVSKISF